MKYGIEEERVQQLNDRDPRDGKYVLYWMQQSQRADWNHALEYAVRYGNEHNLPTVVGFGLMDDYPEANARHYAFLLEGLQNVASELKKRGILFVVKKGAPADVAIDLAADAALVVCDRGYLRHQREWREEVASQVETQVLQVESDVVVPVETASDKAETAARTLRPKIRKHLDRFLGGMSSTRPKKKSLSLRIASDVDLDSGSPLDQLKVDASVGAVKRFKGGTAEARRRLGAFLRGPYDGYGSRRADPAEDTVSCLSPYLHFGQISALEVAHKVKNATSGSAEDQESFLEELIVRRELGVNFVHYTKDYASYSCLPEWARKTLDDHREDEREYTYTRKELEAAETHDEYWNAAMKEMVHTGYMHNYMRMYWGKKIIEWTNTPEYAYRTLLYLNNKHFLDGRDPSSYSNVAWCLGLHDQGWKERPIFGKVRYMNAKGLERKFDIAGYVNRVAGLVDDEKSSETDSAS